VRHVGAAYHHSDPKRIVNGLHVTRERLRQVADPRHQLGRQILKSVVVDFGNDQGVAGADRKEVQERQHLFIFINDVAGQ